MVIVEAILTHFGKFHNKVIRFSPGINLIYGENEAGKTTLHSFLRGMILGIEKPRGRETKDDLYSKYLPWETPTLYGGSLKIQEKEREYLIERNFYKEGKYLRVTDLATGRSQEYESWQTPPQFGRVTKGSYRNTISLEQGKCETDRELEAEMKNYMANLTTSKSSEVDIAFALQSLNEKKKELRDMKLIQRAEQLDREMEELPVLERQRNHLENAIALLLENQKAERKEVVKKVPIKQNKTGASIGFVIVWTVFLLCLILFQGNADGKRIPMYILLAITGAFIYLILRRRELQLAYVDYMEIESGHQDSTEGLDAEQHKRILQLERLRWELEQIEEKLGQMEAKREERKEIEKKLDAAKENMEAIDLAIHTIQQLSQEIHDGFGKYFNEKVSAYADQITNHAYSKVYVDEKLAIKVRSQNTLVPLSKLSAGTMDQLFLALRLSAADLLLGKENMPVILDDSLALYDEARCRATLRMLVEQNRQVLIFTCHKREKEFLEQWKIPYHSIEV